MMKTIAKYMGLLFVLTLVAVPAMADDIPYTSEHSGINTELYEFKANGDDNIDVYFYASDAGYESEIGVWVNGTTFYGYVLDNHTSGFGDMVTLVPAASVSEGDTLEFVLHILDPEGWYYSDPTHPNPDGEYQHVYSVHFPGADHNYFDEYGDQGETIPEGTYVAFEDLPFGDSDWDYNDHQFVFTGIRSFIPEPGILLLLGFGMGAVSLLSFRWKK